MWALMAVLQTIIVAMALNVVGTTGRSGQHMRSLFEEACGRNRNCACALACISNKCERNEIRVAMNSVALRLLIPG